MASVTTGDALNIAQDSAAIVGNSFSGFMGTIHFVGVQYAPRSEMAEPMIAYGQTGSPFSVALTGLLPGTMYDYRAVVGTCDGRCCFGAFGSFVTLQPLPIPMVTTGDAADISQSAATIVGNRFSGISGTIEFVAVQYDTDPNMTAPMTAYGSIGSPFSVGLVGLQPDTAYYYRAIVGASGVTHDGAVKMFVTPTPVPTPSVVTGDATQILENSAVIINNTFSGISGPIRFVGVEYATNPTMADATLAQVAIGSPFNAGLTGLQPDTTYYYRAAVGTSTGTHYGQIKSFVTPATAVIVTTGNATAILPSSAIIIDNRYTGIPGTIQLVGIQHSTSPTMASATTVSGAIGSPFSVNLSGLQPATTYYFRAAINASTGTYFGQIKSFTTPNRTFA